MLNGREWTAVPRGALIKPVKLLPPLDQRHYLIPEEVRRQIEQRSHDVYAVSTCSPTRRRTGGSVTRTGR